MKIAVQLIEVGELAGVPNETLEEALAVGVLLLMKLKKFAVVEAVEI